MSGAPQSVPDGNRSITGHNPISRTSLTCAREARVTAPGGNAGTAGNAGTGLALAVPPEFIEAIAERVADMLAERQPQTAPELLTVDGLLRCKRQRVYDLLSQGRLPHLKDGARVLIRRADLLAYLEGQAPFELEREAA